ncbi:MAG: PEP-CTERM sorting domain-containing protein [Phycisphaerales bacterium]|jgi:hypothetical protein|nr:PEP-CTERM sorting domain-containing protein [Phycisphaerales bacterium]
MKLQRVSTCLIVTAITSVPAMGAYYGSPDPLAADAASVYLFENNGNDATAAGRNLVTESGTPSYDPSGLHGSAYDPLAPNYFSLTMLGLPSYPADSSVIVNTSNFAVEAAVKVQSNQSQTFLGANEVPGWGGSNRVFALRANTDQGDPSKIYFEFAVQDAGGNLLTASSPSVPFSSVQNQWVTIAGRSTGTTLEMYVNGVLVNSSNSAGANENFETNQTVIRFGTDWGGGNRSFAQIDDVALYNTARTNFQAIPEPGTLSLVGLLAMGGLSLRRRKNA